MNVRELLDGFLASGQNMASQGKDFAENKFGLPEAGPERDAMLSGATKGALAAGALALLLGSKQGRKLTKGAVKIGSVAALGGLAYTAYNQWQKGKASSSSVENQAEAAPQAFVSPLSANEQEQHDLKILQAIIAAAKADGHIDETERSAIQQQMEKLNNSSETNELIQTELNKPLNPEEVAAGVDNTELASEIYLVTRVLIDETNFMEQSYLNALIQHLRLKPELVKQLDAHLNA